MSRLLHVFATFAPGGPQVRTVRMIDALGGEFEHALVAMDGRTEAAGLLAEPERVQLIDPPPKAGSLRTVRALRELIRAAAPDLLLTYNWGSIEAVLAARSLGQRRLLHHEDGFLPDEALRLKLRRSYARRLTLPWTRGVILPSETLRDIAVGVWKLPPEHVHLIPNGIRVEDWPVRDGNPELRRELGIPEGVFVVGAVGSLRGEKNFPRLVEAVSRLEDAHLLLLGEGPERAAIEATRDRLGVERRVHLAGHRADPRPCYRAMDAFAISSDTEQMPVALLEAMAAELPVAATAVGDVARMLPVEQALFVTPKDSDALARALRELAGDPELRSSLGAANRRRVLERYTFEGMLAAYRDLYRGALAEPARGRV
ncbi:MAG: glycosyltransferase [Planctomycetota bacterium]|nr:glycosyltransferase [Planctomycetota bacterium]